jgi:hypothetical protein
MSGQDQFTRGQLKLSPFVAGFERLLVKEW